MKSALEIPLFPIYSGSARSVVALGLHGNRPALEYLNELQQHNPKGYRILYGQIRFLCKVAKLILIEP